MTYGSWPPNTLYRKGYIYTLNIFMVDFSFYKIIFLNNSYHFSLFYFGLYFFKSL